MKYEYVIYEKAEGLAVVTMNRPDKMNAFIPELREEIRECIRDTAEDNSIRVFVLTGAGRAFCAGADIGSVAQGRQAEYAEGEALREQLLLPVTSARLALELRGLPKPTIAALNGVAAGAGTTVAMACDIIIASDQARWRLAFTRIGIPPSDGASYFLPRLLGTHRALELAYTNDMIDAREMERLGLVNRVVPHEQLMSAVKETARKMMAIPPLTLALTKRSMYQSLSAHSIEEQMEFEHLVRNQVQGTDDQKEAVASFREKRDPAYKGL